MGTAFKGIKLSGVAIQGEIVNGMAKNGIVFYKKGEAEVDATPPTATFTYSNNNGLSLTKEDVTVTLTVNEPIKDIEGWTKVNETTFTKVYSANGKYSVLIEDLDGNTARLNYEVKRIDRNPPGISVKTGETETIGNATDGYTLVSFKVSDDNGLKEYELNGAITQLSNSKWGDINYVSTSTKGAKEGINTLKVRDRVYNERILEFKLIAGD